MSATLSVIIPCHNNAYFRECLQSLAEQTDHDFTTIIVFDRCTDDSPEIADTFRDRLNIETYRTDGGKPSVARNKGMDECKTDYLTFLDSDDYYCSSEAIENIRYAAQYQIDHGKEADAFRHGIEGDNGVTVRSFCFAWTLRREFANKYNLRFDERLTYLEDMKFEIAVRFANPAFRHYPFGFLQLDSTLIFHRINERSICHDVQRRLDAEYHDYNLVFSDFDTKALSDEQKDFFALVYMQTTFRILAERSMTRRIPFDSLVKRAMPLIRQYTLGRNNRKARFMYNGHPIALWSLLKRDCDIELVSAEKQDELMRRLAELALN